MYKGKFKRRFIPFSTERKVCPALAAGTKKMRMFFAQHERLQAYLLKPWLHPKNACRYSSLSEELSARCRGGRCNMASFRYQSDYFFEKTRPDPRNAHYPLPIPLHWIPLKMSFHNLLPQFTMINFN